VRGRRLVRYGMRDDDTTRDHGRHARSDAAMRTGRNVVFHHLGHRGASARSNWPMTPS
jgi:hypothetical protein